MIDFATANYGDIGSALCALESTDEAAEFWASYVTHLGRPDAELLGKTPEEVARSNIGYLMGYYTPDDRQHVYSLFEEFDVFHPIMGRSEMTPEELVDAGARAMKDGV